MLERVCNIAGRRYCRRLVSQPYGPSLFGHAGFHALPDATRLTQRLCSRAACTRIVATIQGAFKFNNRASPAGARVFASGWIGIMCQLDSHRARTGSSSPPALIVPALKRTPADIERAMR